MPPQCRHVYYIKIVSSPHAVAGFISYASIPSVVGVPTVLVVLLLLSLMLLLAFLLLLVVMFLLSSLLLLFLSSLLVPLTSACSTCQREKV